LRSCNAITDGEPHQSPNRTRKRKGPAKAVTDYPAKFPKGFFLNNLIYPLMPPSARFTL